MKFKLILVFALGLLIMGWNCLWADFGIKIGPSFSFAGGAYAIWNGMRMFTGKVGLFYSIPISNELSIQPEIYYAIKGVKFYNSNHRDWEPLRFNYIEVPILLNI